MPLPNNIDEASATLCWVSLSERRWVNFAERYSPVQESVPIESSKSSMSLMSGV